MKVKELLHELTKLDPESEIFIGSSYGLGLNHLENWELYFPSFYYREKLNSLRSGSSQSSPRESPSLIITFDSEVPPCDNPLGEI